MTTSAGSKNSGSSGSKFGQPNQGLLEGVFVHNRAQGFWAARQRTRYVGSEGSLKLALTCETRTV